MSEYKTHLLLIPVVVRTKNDKVSDLLYPTHQIAQKTFDKQLIHKTYHNHPEGLTGDQYAKEVSLYLEGIGQVNPTSAIDQAVAYLKTAEITGQQWEDLIGSSSQLQDLLRVKFEELLKTGRLNT